jgi:SAM-dependent methyltransferase
MESEIFDGFAKYYDLLYQGKDYHREASFIDQMIRQYSPGSESILDAGCGTGVHDWLLAQMGYKVLGVDQSSKMISIAEKREAEFYGIDVIPRFEVADLVNFVSNEKQDVVVSLFDVVSYLRDYESFNAFASSCAHALKPGGMLFFDCWYGPAVYSQKPETRIRRHSNDQVELTRLVESKMTPESNWIDVEYEMYVHDKIKGSIIKLHEQHLLRCYFDGELNQLLEKFGFSRVFSTPWFSEDKPSTSSWSVLFGYRYDFK